MASPTTRRVRSGPTWWTAAPPLARALLVLASVLTVAAVVVGICAASTSRHVVRRIVTHTAAASVVVDPTGCPVTEPCAVSADAPSQLVAAMRAAFAELPVRYEQTTTGQDAHVYRSEVLAYDESVTVRLSIQCVPGASAVRSSITRSADASLDLAGNSVVHARSLVLVVGATSGCSAAVDVESAGAGQATDDPAMRLVLNAAVVLR